MTFAALRRGLARGSISMFRVLSRLVLAGWTAVAVVWHVGILLGLGLGVLLLPAWAAENEPDAPRDELKPSLPELNAAPAQRASRSVELADLCRMSLSPRACVASNPLPVAL